jgi:GGDEF domain-containing protein
MLLPDCPEAQAEQTARRMLATVLPGHSFSIGIATWHGDEKGYELVHRADQAMYAAKAGGGNRIALARGPASDPLALADHAQSQERRAS